jgi:predicted outer membrane protein
MRLISIVRVAALLLVPTALPACGGAPTYHAESGNHALASAPIDDGQIAELADVIGVQQRYLSQDATKRSANPDVRRLASELVADHTADQEAVLARLAGERVGLQPTALVQLFESQSRETRAWLNSVSDATFDRDFVVGEVKQESRAMDLFDHVLLPGVRADELRALLVRRRQMDGERLAETKQLAVRLGTTPSW